MINSGQMDRQEALRQEEEMTTQYETNMRGILEGTIGLSKKAADKILSFNPAGSV